MIFNFMKTNLTTVIMTALAFVMTIGQASAGNVVVNTSSQPVYPGQMLDINVTIDPLSVKIAGAQLNIEFNKSIVNVNSISEGNLFKQNGANTFFNSGTINNSLGTVTNIYCAVLGSTNVSTPGTFIRINLTVSGITGTSNINLSNVKVSTPDGVLVPSNITNGTIILNSAPVLSPIGAKSVNENQTLSFIVSATDVNGDALTYSATNLPSGASFNTGTKTFSWTPNHNQSGTYPDVRFAVTDGYLTASENITITVNNVNRPPAFTMTPANGSTYNETDTIQINVAASDPDNDTLSYVIKIDGVQVSTSSGYAWVTNYTSSGTHSINVTVSDISAAVSQTIYVSINNVYPRYDVNENGSVDIGDLTVIGQHFGETVTAPYPGYDVNSDGVVDVLDITITAQHFGDST